MGRTFENLTQKELIWLATDIREDKEYVDIIKHHNLMEKLHSIVHHNNSKHNKHYGQWNNYQKNKVIHQIFHKIIPEKDREKYIDTHPQEEENKRLNKELKKATEEYERHVVCHDVIDKIYNVNHLQSKLDKYESSDIKQCIQELDDLKKQFTIHSTFMTHYKLAFIRPLLLKGWIKEKHLQYPPFGNNMCGLRNGTPIRMP